MLFRARPSLCSVCAGNTLSANPISILGIADFAPWRGQRDGKILV